MLGQVVALVCRAALHEDVEQALVAVDGQERFVRSGDTLAAPCLRVAEILDASLLLDSCGAYQLLPIGGSGFNYKPLATGRPQPAARVETIDLRSHRSRRPYPCPGCA